MTLEEAKVELEKFVKLKTTMRPAFVQPLLEAVEQKHGHWDSKGFEPVRCSVCGITVDAINGIPWAIKGFKFCPHCGAKMDEVLNAPLRNGKSMMELERLMDEVEEDG